MTSVISSSSNEYSSALDNLQNVVTKKQYAMRPGAIPNPVSDALRKVNDVRAKNTLPPLQLTIKDIAPYIVAVTDNEEDKEYKTRFFAGILSRAVQQEEEDAQSTFSNQPYNNKYLADNPMDDTPAQAEYRAKISYGSDVRGDLENKGLSKQQIQDELARQALANFRSTDSKREEGTPKKKRSDDGGKIAAEDDDNDDNSSTLSRKSSRSSRDLKRKPRAVPRPAAETVSLLPVADLDLINPTFIPDAIADNNNINSTARAIDFDEPISALLPPVVEEEDSEAALLPPIVDTIIDDESANLKLQLESANQTITELKQENKISQSELQIKREELKAAQIKSQKNFNEQKNLEKQLAKIHGDFKRLEEQNNLSKKQGLGNLNSYNAYKAQQEAVEKDLNEQLAKLKNDQFAGEQNMGALREQVRSLQSEHATKLKDIESANQKAVNELQLKLQEQLKAELEATSNKNSLTIQGLNSKINEAKNELSSKQQQIDKLQKEYNESKAVSDEQINVLKNARTELEKTVQQFTTAQQADLKAQEISMSELRSKISKLTDERDNLNQAKQNSDNELKRIQSNLATLNSELDTLRSEKKGLQTDLENEKNRSSLEKTTAANNANQEINRLSQEIKSKETAISNLQAELTKANNKVDPTLKFKEDQIASLNAEVLRINGEKTSLQMELYNANSAKSQLTTDNNSLKSEAERQLNRFNSEIKTKEEQINRLEGEMNDIKTRNLAQMGLLNQQIISLNGDKSNLQTELRDLKNSNSKLTSDNSSLIAQAKSELDRYTEDIKIKEEEIKRLEGDLNKSLNKGPDPNLKLKDNEIQKLSAKLAEEQKNYNSALEEVNRQLGEARNQVTRAGTDLKSTNEKIAALNTELGKLKSERTELQLNLSTAKNKNDLLSSEKEKLEEEAKQKLAEFNNEIELKEKEIRRLKTQFVSKEDLKKQLEKIEQLESSIERLKTDKDEAKRTSDIELAKLGKDLNTRQAELDKLGKEKTRLQKDLDKEKDRTTALTDEKNQAISDAEKDLELANQDIKKKQREITELREKLKLAAAAKSSSSDPTETKVNNDAQLAELEKQLEQAKDAYEKAETAHQNQLKSIKLLSTKEIGDLNNQLKALNVTKKELEERIEELNKDIADSKTAQNELTRDNEKLKYQSNEEKRNAAREMNKTAKLEGELSALKTQYDSILFEKEQLELTFSALQSQVKTKDQDIKELKQKAKDKKAENDLNILDLNNKIRELERQRDSGSNGSKELQEEIYNLKSQLADKVKEMNIKINNLKNQEQTLQSKMLEQQRESLAQMEKVEKEKVELEKIVLQLNFKITELNQKVGLLEFQLNELQQQNLKLQGAANAVQNQLSSKTAEVVTLNTKLDTLENQMKQLTFQHTQEMLKMTDLNNKITAKDAQITQLIDQLKSPSIAFSATKLVELQNQLQATAGERDLLKTELDKANEVFVQMQAEFDEKEVDYNSLIAERDNLLLKVQQLEITNMDLQHTIANSFTAEQMDDLNKTIEEQIKLLEEKDTEISSLNFKLLLAPIPTPSTILSPSAAGAVTTSSAAEVTRLSRELTNKASEISKLNQRIRDLESDLRTAKAKSSVAAGVRSVSRSFSSSSSDINVRRLLAVLVSAY